MGSVWPATRAGSMTWKPRPDAGPPSAWMETAAAAPARLPMAARSVMQGPTPASLVRVSTTRAPAPSSRRANRWATSKAYADSAYPLAVAAPAVSQGLCWVTASTRRPISAGWAPLAPLWPGSSTTVLPARTPDARAVADGAAPGTEEEDEVEPSAVEADAVRGGGRARVAAATPLHDANARTRPSRSQC